MEAVNLFHMKQNQLKNNKQALADARGPDNSAQIGNFMRSFFFSGRLIRAILSPA